MKRTHLLIFTLFALSASLVACLSSAPQATITPEAIVILPPPTLTFTPTEPPTLIPPTSTPEEQGPTPEQIAKIAEINGDWGGIISINPEDMTVVYKAGTEQEAPMTGLLFNPDKKVLNLDYDKAGIETEAGPGFVLDIPLSEVLLGWNGETSVAVKDVSAFDWDSENHKLVRERYKDINNNVSETVEVYPLDEARLIQLQNHSNHPDDVEDSAKHRDKLLDYYYTGGPIGNYKSFRYKDVVEVRGATGWGDNGMPVWNEEKGVWEKLPTSFYAVNGIGSSGKYAIMAWEDENREQKVIIIKGNRLEKPDNWGYYDDTHRP